ncbi:NUDIX domain-containing protein [Nocardia sp. BMG111209]|uniref:NUDIX hydrolase n=1 Tax=Nocardia sp. BMG111209 TaxID=1160137 RepID=UPI00036E43F8|nr:NUDIX domain-containing protein [Nocardia sp. BMG111209]
MRSEPVERLIDTVAWVLIEEGRILCARPRGKDVFYIPGGKREPGESDLQTLLREIDEELTVALLPGTVAHVGTYDADVPGEPGVLVRMACYTAEFAGTLAPSSEIDEIAWFGYADRDRVPPVDRILFDDLVARGLLPR